MTIGYVNPEYNARRNIVGACENVRYERVRTWHGLIRQLPGCGHVFNIGNYAFCGGYSRGRIDLMHYFDRITMPPSRIPFVTTIEDSIPRLFGKGWFFQKGIERLSSKYCRQIIAFSSCAKRRQEVFNAEYGIQDVDRKVTVLLPRQDVLVTAQDIARRDTSGVLRFVFIGKAFFRKGAWNAIRALSKVRQHCAVELEIIGNVDYFDYAHDKSYDDCGLAHRYLEENSGWIHYHPVMPNADVLELLKTCHVGLLPTRDDSFGYSVLEMQAAGLPCITTDIWSLPEINNDACGWIANVGKNDLGQADYSTRDGIAHIDEQIVEGLLAAVEDLVSNRSLLKEKGLVALNRVREFHDPSHFGRRLFEIYTQALEDGR